MWTSGDVILSEDKMLERRILQFFDRIRRWKFFDMHESVEFIRRKCQKCGEMRYHVRQHNSPWVCCFIFQWNLMYLWWGSTVAENEDKTVLLIVWMLSDSSFVARGRYMLKIQILTEENDRLVGNSITRAKVIIILQQWNQCMSTVQTLPIRKYAEFRERKITYTWLLHTRVQYW